MAKKSKIPESEELTEKQKAFCAEYIFDWNASRSYKLAYPDSTEDAARVSASRLLTNPNIQAYIKEIQLDLEKTTGISRQMVIREHQKVAFSSIAHLHNTWIERKAFEELTEDQKACIAEIHTQTRMEKNPIENGSPIQVDFVKIKLYDKQKSLDSISKMLGYNEPEKVQHLGSDQIFVIGGKQVKF